MNSLLEFALLGLGTGAIYALSAQGLVLIYRGSGTINFAHGAIALLGAAIFVELRDDMGWPILAAAFAGIAATAFIGAIIDFAIMRRISGASPLARLVVTLGILGVIESIVIIRYGSSLRFVDPYLPDHMVQLTGDIALGADRLLLCVIAIITTAGLWLLYQRSEFGRQTTAVAENPQSAAALGISPNMISSLNWTLGCAMAGLAGILLIPLTGLMPVILVLMIIPTLAAALIGGFQSFPITLLAGLCIGILQSIIGGISNISGLSDAIPFLAIIIILIIKGRALPLRGFVNDRLPPVSAPHISWPKIAIAFAMGCLAIFLLSEDYLAALTGSLITATAIISIILLTGFAGQLSLGQYAFVGAGAFISARLADLYGLPFPLAFIIGVAGTMLFGLIFALPALRTRGINLAVITLGLGVALDSLIFKNKFLTGGFEGTEISPPSLFGIELDSIIYPQRYAMLALILFTICAIMLLNIRRGTSGRRLLAIRSNERAASSLGINITNAKLFAFALAAGFAAAAGVLKAFRFPNVRFESGYSMFDSIPAVLMGFLGGIGYVGGALIGGLIAIGGIANEFIGSLFDLAEWQALLISASAIAMVMIHPAGIAPALASAAKKWGRNKKAAPIIIAPDINGPAHEHGKQRADNVQPKSLKIENLCVRFGGVVALNDVSFDIQPGKITGLIGPNGAGKTSLIDAITGFNAPQSGRILLDDADIMQKNAAARARCAIGRTFQNLELFDDLNVADNIAVACDSGDAMPYLRDPFWPRPHKFPPAARHAIHAFGFAEKLGSMPAQLSYGERRMLAIARSVAANPSVLLLDEPAAGLGAEERAKVAQLIRSLADDWGMAILLVEHDMSLVMNNSDHIVVLDFGQKIADDIPAKIAKNPQVIKAYLGDDDGGLNQGEADK